MSTTTWIIIIVVIVLILIIIGVVVYFAFFRNTVTVPDSGGGGNNGGNTPSNGVKYGDIVSLFNIDPSFGGYAFLCPTADSPCINATIRSTPFKQWKIVDTNLRSTGNPISYGQQFKLQVVQSGQNRYLGYCSGTTSECGTNVGTIMLPQETTTWTFGKLNTNTTSNVVTLNTNLEIINTDIDRNKLYVCGVTDSCGTNITNFNNRGEDFPSLSTWQLR